MEEKDVEEEEVLQQLEVRQEQQQVEEQTMTPWSQRRQPDREHDVHCRIVHSCCKTWQT